MGSITSNVFQGVLSRTGGRTWESYLKVSGKTHWLSSYSTQEAAASARDRVLYKLGRLSDIQLPLTNESKSELDAITLDQLLATFAAPFSRGSSTYRGVSWKKNQSCWLACIGFNGHTTNIGIYRDEDDAARAYDRRAFALWGMKAKLNFPHEYLDRESPSDNEAQAEAVSPQSIPVSIASGHAKMDPSFQGSSRRPRRPASTAHCHQTLALSAQDPGDPACSLPRNPDQHLDTAHHSGNLAALDINKAGDASPAPNLDASLKNPSTAPAIQLTGHGTASTALHKENRLPSNEFGNDSLRVVGDDEDADWLDDDDDDSLESDVDLDADLASYGAAFGWSNLSTHLLDLGMQPGWNGHDWVGWAAKGGVPPCGWSKDLEESDMDPGPDGLGFADDDPLSDHSSDDEDAEPGMFTDEELMEYQEACQRGKNEPNLRMMPPGECDFTAYFEYFSKFTPPVGSMGIALRPKAKRSNKYSEEDLQTDSTLRAGNVPNVEHVNNLENVGNVPNVEHVSNMENGNSEIMPSIPAPAPTGKLRWTKEDGRWLKRVDCVPADPHAQSEAQPTSQDASRQQVERMRKVQARILTDGAAIGLLPASAAEGVPEFSTDDDSDMEDLFQKVMRGEDIVGSLHADIVGRLQEDIVGSLQEDIDGSLQEDIVGSAQEELLGDPQATLEYGRDLLARLGARKPAKQYVEDRLDWCVPMTDAEVAVKAAQMDEDVKAYKRIKLQEAQDTSPAAVYERQLLDHGVRRVTCDTAYKGPEDTDGQRKKAPAEANPGIGLPPPGQPGRPSSWQGTRSITTLLL